MPKKERKPRQRTLQVVGDDAVFYEDFEILSIKLLETLEGRMKADKDDLDNSMVAIADNFSLLKDELKAEIEARAEEFKGELSKTERAFLTRLEAKISQLEGAINSTLEIVDERVEKALEEQANGMKFVYDKVSPLKNGKDGENGKDANPKEITKAIIAELWPRIQEEITKDAPQRKVLGGMGGSRFFGSSVVVKSLYNQSFVETPNGVITAFTLIKAPRTTGAERIYQNNTRRFPGSGNDYTILNRTVTFNVAPQTGDILMYDIEHI